VHIAPETRNHSLEAYEVCPSQDQQEDVSQYDNLDTTSISTSVPAPSEAVDMSPGTMNNLLVPHEETGQSQNQQQVGISQHDVLDTTSINTSVPAPSGAVHIVPEIRNHSLELYEVCPSQDQQEDVMQYDNLDTTSISTSVPAPSEAVDMATETSNRSLLLHETGRSHAWQEGIGQQGVFDITSISTSGGATCVVPETRNYVTQSHAATWTSQNQQEGINQQGGFDNASMSASSIRSSMSSVSTSMSDRIIDMCQGVTGYSRMSSSSMSTYMSMSAGNLDMYHETSNDSQSRHEAVTSQELAPVVTMKKPPSPTNIPRSMRNINRIRSESRSKRSSRINIKSRHRVMTNGAPPSQQTEISPPEENVLVSEMRNAAQPPQQIGTSQPVESISMSHETTNDSHQPQQTAISEHLNKTLASAILIQSFARRVVARGKFKKYLEYIVNVQRFSRRIITRRRSFRICIAARNIQRVWQHYMARKMRRIDRAIIVRRRNISARNIQRVWRHIKWMIHTHNAALRIQKNCRAFIIRRRLFLRGIAARNIQRNWRYHIMSIKIRRIFRAVIIKRRIIAARNIQRVWRICRPVLENKRKAAETIQVLVRTFLCQRKRMMHIFTAQSFIRGVLVRIRVNKIKKAQANISKAKSEVAQLKSQLESHKKDRSNDVSLRNETHVPQKCTEQFRRREIAIETFPMPDDNWWKKYKEGFQASILTMWEDNLYY
jgi:hypothetical protein